MMKGISTLVKGRIPEVAGELKAEKELSRLSSGEVEAW